MKKRVLRLSLLMSCCFILFLCSAKNSRAETYIPDVNWDLYKDAKDNEVQSLIDKNYNITIDLDKKSASYGAWICDVYVSGNEIELPEKVEFNGEAYPLTQFIATLSSHGNEIRSYQSIIFPDSVKKIELNRNWPNVTKINIPKSMESLWIEENGPKNVQFIVPDSMDHYTFQNNALYSKQNPGTLVYPLNIPEKYTIAEGTTTLAAGCFKNNCAWRYVKEITCPASLTEISGSDTFRGCLELESVDMEKSKIKDLKLGAFCDTPKLKKVLLPQTLKKIDDHVFWKSGISQLSIPAKVNVIGDRAFWKCKKLKKISFEGTKMPKFVSTEVFKNARSGIKFSVKNKKMAKQLKKRLKKSKVKKAKIYVGKKKKLLYKNING